MNSNDKKNNLKILTASSIIIIDEFFGTAVISIPNREAIGLYIILSRSINDRVLLNSLALPSNSDKS